MTELQKSFITLVGKAHGEDMRKACQRIIADQEKHGGGDFRPLAVLHQAERELYGDQSEAAAAAANRCFRSDGDL